MNRYDQMLEDADKLILDGASPETAIDEIFPGRLTRTELVDKARRWFAFDLNQLEGRRRHHPVATSNGNNEDESKGQISSWRPQRATDMEIAVLIGVAFRIGDESVAFLDFTKEHSAFVRSQSTARRDGYQKTIDLMDARDEVCQASGVECPRDLQGDALATLITAARVYQSASVTEQAS